jgi:hypothetical protein
MEITVRVVTNYGEKIYYPVCDRANWFAEIAGTKTLTENTRLCITKLGYTIKLKQEVYSG